MQIKIHILAIIALVLTGYIIKEEIKNTDKKMDTNTQVLSTVIKKNTGLPVRLTIPAIHVDANIQPVGITETGEMEVPNNTREVAWFAYGVRPGEIGSAVIAGHLNGENGEGGVFFDLHKLKKGDKLYVKDDAGKETVFIVRESKIYNPVHTEEVFDSNGASYLNLITCDGVWNKDKKSYSKRLVVFTDISN